VQILPHRPTKGASVTTAEVISKLEEILQAGTDKMIEKSDDLESYRRLGMWSGDSYAFVDGFITGVGFMHAKVVRWYMDLLEQEGIE
jgi:hypothetical protein